ncbi:restriction endonuclease subunit S [Gammaproteobacteria bacterium]|nr:restriction endonuclease subunit S [Gammaproteobacteria bacterium]
MSSAVPEGWQISSIEDLLTPNCLFSDGDWVESKDQDPAGTNRLLQLADIGDGRFVNKSNRFMNDEQFNRLNCTQLQEGDVLIARMPEPIGRACILPRLDNRLATVVDIAILRPSAVDSYWLMSVINSAGFRTKIEEQSSGTTRTRIGRTALSKIKLLSPPLPEQKKIASILTSVDEVIENTQKQIDKLQDLKKATMNELLTKGIGHTEFKDSELGRIPKSWEVSSLGECFNLTSGKSKPKRLLSSVKTQLSKVPVYGGNGVTGYTDSELLDEQTIVIGRVGEYCGCVHLTPKLCWITDNALYIKSITRVFDLSFMFHLMVFSDLAQLQSKGGQPLVSQKPISEFVIALPPIVEQQKIASFIDAISSNIDNQSVKLSQTQSLKKSLMQDLLTGKVRVTVN